MTKAQPTLSSKSNPLDGGAAAKVLTKSKFAALDEASKLEVLDKFSQLSKLDESSRQAVLEELSKLTGLDELSKLVALDELTWAVVFLYFRQSANAEIQYQEGEHSAGRRSLLRSLKMDGPATVPQLARARPVSRQFIQKLANEMVADGLVEFINNPEHKRSKLVRITAKGERLLMEMMEQDIKLGTWLVQDLNESDIRTATRVVRTLREKLVRVEEWKALLDLDDK